MSECIAGMKEGFRILSEGNAILPLRSRISVQKQEGISLFMPAYLPETDSESLVIKIVSVFNKNPEQNLPLIHAAVLVLDEETGQVAALIEGASLTAIRTGAASGAATDLLARKDAEILAVFGAGVQAATQLEAVCEIRDIKEVRRANASIH
jgi:ornithine cyclodeaminase/alanine dehydrogenase-like protein (mu-crystallin family)